MPKTNATAPQTRRVQVRPVVGGSILGFINWLFGSSASRDELPPQTSTGEPVVERAPRSSQHRFSDAYFDTMSRMQTAVSQRNFEEAGQLVRRNLDYISGWVKETCRENGSFDIRMIPALQQGGTVLALLGDDQGLDRMREIVSSAPELQPWVEKVGQHQEDRRLFQAILEAVTTHPSCLQTEVKDLVDETDGHRVANLISYLEKSGKIVRIRSGRTYRLLPPDSPGVPAPPPKQIVGSHRTDQKSPRLREIDASLLSYMPLPRAPLRWEETQVGRERAAVPVPEDHFEVRDADWQIAMIEKIPAAERPDTAFRQMHPTGTGIIMLDDLGKAEGLGQIQAAALHYNRVGELTAKVGLRHCVYRVGVHPLGCGLIAMSGDCVVHAYDSHLEPILETTLTKASEILTLRKRFDVPDDQLKNHIRCVALSQDATRYLFTTVDEAWCVDMAGKGVWGVKLPFKEGWTRVSTPSTVVGTSAEVDRALALMDLSFPITPEDVKRRYRELAKQWHPDLNPRNLEGHEKMKLLTGSAELLTGVAASVLPCYMGTTFFQEIERTEFKSGGVKFEMNMGMQVGEIQAADWVYAASFAASSDAVYLAGYSGRVVVIDENGEAMRAYDIGNVPCRIVDTGDYLYLLTDTRLYVLRDDALHALVDTFDGGDLIVAQTGFGLLEKKRLRWFHEDGRYVGSVVTRDPIRRVYSTGDGMVAETRQRRAVVQGVPTWWE